VTDLFQEPADATPLTLEERNGLRPSWIVTRQDLNAAEQDNIAQGAAWARRRRSSDINAMLSDNFALELHVRILGEVWSWAGTYSQTGRNIGIEPVRIPTEMRSLFDDVRYWVAHKTYPPDEIAIRLHHRLVAIHPFPNGNGRLSRLMADLLIEKLGGEPFSWGSGSLTTEGELRTAYIAALQAADKHDIAPLLAFARS
jgi:Fic-DOC domain mobile mystery protein B